MLYQAPITDTRGKNLCSLYYIREGLLSRRSANERKIHKYVMGDINFLNPVVDICKRVCVFITQTSVCGIIDLSNIVVEGFFCLKVGWV
jgi:hypothetical protein